jgi:uncharacterized protein (TIGR03435 family)
MLWISLSVLVILATALAQAPPPASLAFDVVSIKPTPANPPVTTIGAPQPGGRWSPRNVTALMIMGRAFPAHALPGLIVGGPGWLAERRFDIDARVDRPATPAHTRR